MYRILLPVDDNEARARAQAEFVTGLPGTAEIEVVVTHALTAEETDVPHELQNLDRIDTVRLVRDRLEDTGVAVELAEARHPPADGILEIAAELDIDHIAMGTHHRSPTGKALFGSVAQTVLLDADVPVTIVTAESE